MAKPLRLALGALIIQQEYGYSDEELTLQIQENPYLQYFCGYSCFDDSKPPFDASLMVHFRKRITPEVLAEINEMIEGFRVREGHYPGRVLADKIYRNRENLRFCKERGIRLSGPALGRPKKGEVRNKTQDYRDECERVEVERRFSLSKRKCGMGLVTAKLQETAEHVIAMSILLLNLRRAYSALLLFFRWLLPVLQPNPTI